MVTIGRDVAEQVAGIIGDTLNGWFAGDLCFDPVVVRQRYDDWYDEDYLEAWIVWEGNHDKMDPSLTITLHRYVYPYLDEVGIDVRLHPRFVARWDWDLNREQLLK